MDSSFVPSKLTLARQLRSFTKRHLAENAGLSAQAVTDFEVGGCTPSLSTADQLAFALDFPMSFFYTECAIVSPMSPVSYRAKRSMSTRVREKAEAAGILVSGVLTPAFAERFIYPEIDLPDLTGEDPEEAAETLRAAWGLGVGPISNVVHLLERHGVHVYWINEDCPTVDAVSFWREGIPFMLLNYRSGSGERARFDAAHELGHLVLHRSKDDLVSEELEREANRFAAAFLMPREQFLMESPRQPILQEYVNLKPRWKISVQAMLRRSRETGVISGWQHQSGMKELSAKGWRRSEPSPVLRECSELHRQMLQIMAAQGVDAATFASQLGLTTALLAELMPAVRELNPHGNYDGKVAYKTLQQLGYSGSLL